MSSQWKSLSALLEQHPAHLVLDPGSPKFSERLGEQLRTWLTEFHPEVASRVCVFDYLLSDIRTRRFYGAMLFPESFESTKYRGLLDTLFKESKTVGSHLVFQAGLPQYGSSERPATSANLDEIERRPDATKYEEGYLFYSYEADPQATSSASATESPENANARGEQTLKAEPVTPTAFLPDAAFRHWQDEASKADVFAVWDDFCGSLGALGMTDTRGRSLSVFYGLPLVLLSTESKPSHTRPVGAAFIGLSRDPSSTLDYDNFLRSFYLFASRSVAAQHAGSYDRAQAESDILHRLPSNLGAIRNALLLQQPQPKIPLSFNALYLWTCLAKFRRDSTIEVPEWGEIEAQFGRSEEGAMIVTQSAIERLIIDIAIPIAKSRRLQSGGRLFGMSPKWTIDSTQGGFACGSEREARVVLGVILILLQEGFQHAWTFCTDADPLRVEIADTHISVTNHISDDEPRARRGHQYDELELLRSLLNQISSTHHYKIQYLTHSNDKHWRSSLSSETTSQGI